MRTHLQRHRTATALAICLAACALCRGQTQNPLGYSISTPRPISPAEGTTTPSAQATQRQNPYLGSVPSQNTGTRIGISLKDALNRGLRFNLGLIETNQASATVRAERLRALSAMLPQIAARAQQAQQDRSFREFGLKLPPSFGIGQLPPTSGNFGFQDARITLAFSVFDANLRNRYQARKRDEEASRLTIEDSRDVVVFAVGSAYLQVVAGAARLNTSKAQLASAAEFERQTTNRVQNEVSPEIDLIRAQVERQSAEQRVTDVTHQLEKDKLTLGRIIGLAIDQQFDVTDPLGYHPPVGLTAESAVEQAMRSRRDLRSAEASVAAAAFQLRSQKAERLPTLSLSADYGGAGINVGNFSQVHTLVATLAVPIFTGGRIRSEIQQAQADLARREAEYADLKGRVAYDVRVAWLDLTASDSSIKVAERNKMLAERGLTQSKDRYENGVTNYLEILQAQEAVTAAAENYIQSLFSYNAAMVSLARAVGDAETRLPALLGRN